MSMNTTTAATASTPSVDALVAHLERRLPAYLALLEEMVAINSFTRNAAGVDRLGDVTAAAFAAFGFGAERIASRNPAHGAHLVLSRGGRSDGRVGLISHLDTVFPAEEEVANGFGFRPDGDRLYGPGTVDIKGGTVMIYMVMDALRTCAPAVFDALGWDVLLDAAEETMAPDFGALMRERLLRPGGRSLACLVFEGCRRTGDAWHLVTRRKGMAVATIDVTGRGAHAGGAHDQGANAILQLSRLVERASALTDAARGLTVNVGVIEGGTVTNRVPHHASARLEMRADSPEVLAEATARLLALADTTDVATADGAFTCRAEVRIDHAMPAWPTNDGTEALYSVWAAAAADVGLAVRPEARGGLSDGNWVWADVATLDGLGPHGDNLHCSEHDPAAGKTAEYATRSSFVPKAAWNAVALCRLAAAHGLA